MTEKRPAPTVGRKVNAAERRRLMGEFLDVFAMTANVTIAAEAVGLSRSTVYYWRDKYKTFAEGWDDAEAEAADRLEAEAWRRAVHGVTEPVFYLGEVVGGIQKYSDTLMARLLSAHKPEKYRERRETKHTGEIEINERPNPREDLLSRLNRIRQRRGLEPIGEGDDGGGG